MSEQAYISKRLAAALDAIPMGGEITNPYIKSRVFAHDRGRAAAKLIAMSRQTEKKARPAPSLRRIITFPPGALSDVAIRHDSMNTVRDLRGSAGRIRNQGMMARKISRGDIGKSERSYLEWRRYRETEVSKLSMQDLKFTRAHGLTYGPKALGGRVMRAPIRKKPDLRGPLKPGEYYHGTSREGAAKIREEGFKLVDPRGPNKGGDALRAKDKAFSEVKRFTSPTTTRAGRPKSAGDLGPGVYLTQHKRTARGFAGYVDTKGRVGHLLVPRGRGETLKVRIDPDVKVKSRTSLKTPAARKQGYGGVEQGSPTRAMHQVAIGDPRKVHVVDTPMRYGAGWTPGEYTLAAGAVGGGGYGANKLRQKNQQKGRPATKQRVGAR